MSGGFLAELKRRRVFRVAAVYGVLAFGALQVADIVVEPLALPAWTMTLLVVLAALGFPIAVGLAWAFEVTPDGVRREPEPEEADKPGKPGEALPAAAGHSPGGRGLSPAARIAVVGAVAILALAGGAFMVLGDGPELVDSRVAVEAFENRTGEQELEAVGAMAADWLIRSLQQTGSLAVIPLDATGPGGGGAVRGRRDRARSLGAEFGARLVVTGSYYLEGDSLRILAEVTDARNGDLLFTADPVSAPRAAPSRAFDTLQQTVGGFLATWGEWSEQGHGALVTLTSPPSLEAYREYMAGNELFVRGDYRASQPHLHRAIALDSTFVAAIARAAVAHTNVGEYTAAEPLVAMLDRLRERMTPYERIQTDWLNAMVDGDNRTALVAARRAAAMAPVPTWHYLVGLYAIRLNRPAEALEALTRIDPDGYVGREWRPFWSVLARAHHLAGDYESELETLAEARQRHPGHGQYTAQEIAALAGLGHVDRARAAIESAATRTFDSGLDAGGVLRSAARELIVHGHPEAAAEAARRAVDWYAHTAPESHPLGSARALYDAGRCDEALASLEALRASRPADPAVLGDLGAAAACSGHTATARAMAAELAAIDRPYLFGRASYQRARIAALLDDTDRAIRLLRRALSEGTTIDALHADPDLIGLHGHPELAVLLRPRG